ncbi:DUF2723 domain-containing protein [bacterium]|nr:DUF2723 domain-containing protein [bacterium]
MAQVLAVGWSLALACSVSMWSQAVIAEVYGLHSLCVMLYVVSLYRWLRDPAWTNGLAWSAFFFALGMSNHHLMISLSVLPVMVLVLKRRDFLAEGLLYLSGVAALVYWGFGYLSQEPATWHSSVRGGGGSVALRVHADGLFHESADELGFHQHQRGLLLRDQSQPVLWQVIRPTPQNRRAHDGRHPAGTAAGTSPAARGTRARFVSRDARKVFPTLLAQDHRKLHSALHFGLGSRLYLSRYGAGSGSGVATSGGHWFPSRGISPAGL